MVRSTDAQSIKKDMKKYLIGFGLFLAYFVVARQLENRIAIIKKLTGAA